MGLTQPGRRSFRQLTQRTLISVPDTCTYHILIISHQPLRFSIRFEVKKDNYPGYNIWGLSLTEVELDVLTGEMRVVRTDLVEDAGLSTSPAVDIGQVEGAFVMGLGLWTSEEVRYDTETGELLTCNSWEYKPPAAKDIPQDFRVTLLRNARNPVGALSSKGCSG